DAGLAVDAMPVPQHRQRAAQGGLEQAEELHGVRRLGVAVWGQQAEAQTQTLAHRADGDGADRRDAVTPIPSGQDRGLALRAPGAPHRGQQEKARFVQKSHVGTTLARLAENAWELVAFPEVDLLVVALAGTTLRLLARPAQPRVQKPADVVVVIADV